MGTTDSTEPKAADNNKSNAKEKPFKLYSSSMYVIPRKIGYKKRRKKKNKLKTDTCMINNVQI